MTCCGKSKSVLEKSKNIVTGIIRHATGKKCPDTDARIRTCHTCDEQTWMSRKEYAEWLIKNGIKILENFTQLGKLPKLPKYDLARGRRNLYRRICKCFVPGKSRVESEKCPLGKWKAPNAL